MLFSRQSWCMFRNPLEEQGDPAFSGSPNKGGQNQNWPTSGRKCYIIPTFLGIPKQRGTKSELAAEALPSGGPTSGRKCYITPAFSGIPNKGDNIKAQGKTKKNKEKTLSGIRRLPPLGLEPTTLELQRHCFTH